MGLLLGGSSSGVAQQWGLVWRPPEDSLRALQEWQRLQQTGVQALRLESTDVPTFLLEAADASGLALFVELPMVEVPARQLRRRLPEMQAVLRTLLQQVAAHPSVRAIGLARLVDTADPNACTYFEVLRAEVQQVRPDLQVYYETRFIEADRCGRTVDFVLVDARDVSDPLRLLQRWQQAHPTVPVGVGRLGTWVRSDTLRGRRVPHAPEWQARYLEQHLKRLQDAFAGPVFVYRWRDVRRTSPALHLDRPFVESYGLHDLQGQARPAFEVVRGFFTGTQTIFAFPAGTPPARSWPWAVLMGWGATVLLVLSYRFSPLFRLLGMRYFRAHGFYTEAVQHGRDLPVGALWGLGVAEGGALGVTVAVIAQMLRESAAVAWGVRLVPLEVGRLVVEAMHRPVMLSLFVLLGSVGLLGLWALGLTLLSRWGHRIGFMQAWTLAHMPRWPLFALMITALSLQPGAEGGQGLLALWLFIEGWGMVRTLRDVAQVVKGAGWMYLLITLLHPSWWLLLVVLGSLGWGLYTGHTIFFWHLLTIP